MRTRITVVYSVSRTKNRLPDPAYPHIVELRVTGNYDRACNNVDLDEFLKKIRSDKVFVPVGRCIPQTIVETVNTRAAWSSWRHRIANVSIHQYMAG